MTKMGRRKKFRKHLSTMAIAGVVLLMLVFVSVASMGLKVQNTKKQARIDELNALIAEEEERAKEIEEYGKYVQTKKYAEEVAKEKLGLVYEDEIIFKAED
jgi:cell division protein DivIC